MGVVLSEDAGAGGSSGGNIGIMTADDDSMLVAYDDYLRRFSEFEADLEEVPCPPTTDRTDGIYTAISQYRIHTTGHAMLRILCLFLSIQGEATVCRRLSDDDDADSSPLFEINLFHEA